MRFFVFHGDDARRQVESVVDPVWDVSDVRFEVMMLVFSMRVCKDNYSL